MIIRSKSTWFFCVVCLVVFLSFSMAGAESEYKDTPYFSGMPNHKIIDANDQEFSDYRFFNGKDCTTVEGKKYFRAYTLKANPGLIISVEGHTDNVGNPKSNQILSDERAKSVVAAIVARSIDAKRLRPSVMARINP